MTKYPAAAVAFVVSLTPGVATSQKAVEIDAAKVSPERFRVLLENEDARVVEYSLAPGQRDEWHTHPAKVSYVLSGGTLRITLGDGTSFVSDEKAGHTAWMNALPRHYAENIGNTPVRIVLVEVKRVAQKRAAASEDPAALNPTSIEVKLENDSVRVMEALLEPGYKEKLHTHPPYVMYIVDGGKVRLNMSDGRMRESEFKAGDVFFSERISHWAENIGTTTIRVLLVEIRS